MSFRSGHCLKLTIGVTFLHSFCFFVKHCLIKLIVKNVYICVTQHHLMDEQGWVKQVYIQRTLILSSVTKLLKRIMLLLPQKLSHQWKESTERGGESTQRVETDRQAILLLQPLTHTHSTSFFFFSFLFLG